MPVYELKTPISIEEIRKLKVNDIVYITGVMVTARDAAHRRMLELHSKGESLPVDLNGGVIYHCGPIVSKVDDHWRIVAAGPTTSTRMEMYEADVIKKFNVRVIVGKGGMGPKTTEAMKKFGAVYTAFTGGAAVLAAKAIKRVVEVHWLDLGVPEALWVLEVEKFGPLTVAIDSHGNNLYASVKERASKDAINIYRKLGLE